VTDGWHEEPRQEPPAERAPAAGPSTLVRTGSAGRGPGLIVVAVAVFVAIALVKPWPGASGPRPTPRAVAPAPTQRPSVDPLAATRADCQDPPSWRIYSRERWPGGTLRSWRTLVPNASATGPLDASIAAIPISTQIETLGFCSPWEGPERPPDDATVEAWAIVVSDAARPAVRVAVPLALRSASRTLAPPYGALFVPPAVPGHIRTDLWPVGTYVFVIEGAGFRRSWAVRIGADDEERAAP
jgi:hypothetical protein